MHKYNCFSKHGKILSVTTNPLENKNLREIVAACGITKHITFHMARHTFATQICLSNGMSIETLSKMMGHSNIRTTQIYAKITNLKVQDDMKQLSSRIKNILWGRINFSKNRS